MALRQTLALAVLLRSSLAAQPSDECSADGECGSEESSLLALRGEQISDTRRRLPPVQCHNRDGVAFNCAGGDTCCGDVCVAMGDVCCINANGNTFPCQGQGGGCCGNACFAPGSKCCRSPFKPKNLWYPVSQATQCRAGFSELAPIVNWIPEISKDVKESVTESSLLAVGGKQEIISETRRRLPPVQCHNRDGVAFNCAGGDTCCGDVCVAMGDVCCINVNGNTFPCQGNGGGCCGNACFAPGSKCCSSPFKPKNLWYPVSQATKCRSGFGDWNPIAPYVPQIERLLKDAFVPDSPHTLVDVGEEHNSETRRRLPPVQCHNRDGVAFNCAGGDTCCGDVCVAMGDVCCINVKGNTFPCQGSGGGCCGNACFAPGSKCCSSPFKPKNLWYPVSQATKCRSGFGDWNPIAPFVPAIERLMKR